MISVILSTLRVIVGFIDAGIIRPVIWIMLFLIGVAFVLNVTHFFTWASYSLKGEKMIAPFDRTLFDASSYVISTGSYQIRVSSTNPTYYPVYTRYKCIKTMGDYVNENAFVSFVTPAYTENAVYDLYFTRRGDHTSYYSMTHFHSCEYYDSSKAIDWWRPIDDQPVEGGQFFINDEDRRRTLWRPS